MDSNIGLLAAVLILGVGMFFGFFVTKTAGFGKYATSTLVIIAVIVFSSLLFAAGKIDEKTIANIMFSALGFAGGLLAPREKE